MRLERERMLGARPGLGNVGQRRERRFAARDRDRHQRGDCDTMKAYHQTNIQGGAMRRFIFLCAILALACASHAAEYRAEYKLSTVLPASYAWGKAGERWAE